MGLFSGFIAKKGGETIVKAIQKTGEAVTKIRESKHGNQENREIRANNIELSQQAYKNKFGSKLVFGLTATPFIFLLWVWFMSPLLKNASWGGELVVDYLLIVDGIGVSALMMVVGSLLGINKLGDSVDKKRSGEAIQRIIDKELEKEKEIEKVKVEKEKEVEKEKVIQLAKNGELLSPFESSYKSMKKHEGGYVDLKQDRGGETYKGIARKMHPNWKGWEVIDQMKKEDNFPKNLDLNLELEVEIKNFYFDNFWKRFKCDEIALSSRKVADELFETSVNMGTYGVKFLQRAFNMCNDKTGIPNLKVDGGIGSKTIQAVTSLLPKYETAIYNAQNGEQYIHYCKLAEKDPSQKMFLRGWFNRV